MDSGRSALVFAGDVVNRNTLEQLGKAKVAVMQPKFPTLPRRKCIRILQARKWDAAKASAMASAHVVWCERVGEPVLRKHINEKGANAMESAYLKYYSIWRTGYVNAIIALAAQPADKRRVRKIRVVFLAPQSQNGRRAIKPRRGEPFLPRISW
ncbi:unnamed protein product [Amoebophrya sp. A25]|nr:unnamed protein product [Amoebophrya sp. A25]|eukprot:GSA25T00018894001.1